jgi:hypothetical protein
MRSIFLNLIDKDSQKLEDKIPEPELIAVPNQLQQMPTERSTASKGSFCLRDWKLPFCASVPTNQLDC